MLHKTNVAQQQQIVALELIGFARRGGNKETKLGAAHAISHLDVSSAVTQAYVTILWSQAIHAGVVRTSEIQTFPNPC